MDNDKILQEEGEVILPITHESCVLNDEGQPLTRTIGNVSNLYTKERTLVGAINEVYAASLKQQMVEMLLDKGIHCNINMTFVELLDLFRSINSSDGVGLDIISATELPATGRDNQICVISDNPTDNFLISQNIDDINSNNNNITIYTDTSGTKVPITTNNLVTNYYFGKVCQGDNRLASYIYQNGNWEQLTQKYVVLIENGTYLNESYHGGITAGANLAKYVAGKGIQNKDTNSNSCYVTFNNKIDFSTYDSLKVTVYTSDSNAGSLFMFAGSGTINTNTTATITVNYQSESKTITMTSTTFTFDISSWTGSHYLGAYLMGGYLSRGYITDIILC